VLILGLSTMTESAAALMSDGELLAAAEEERFTRVKHAGGFPIGAVRYVLESQGCTLSDVDHVAVYWDPYRLAFRARYLIETMLRHPVLFTEKLKRALRVWHGAAGDDSGWSDMFKTGRYLAEHFGYRHDSIQFLDHHECHIASALYPSTFADAALLIMDGAGEEACTTWATGEGVVFRKLGEHRLPHSLGHFYSAVTGYLGFKMLDGEYKLMGLSPYGDPTGARWIRDNYLLDRGEGRYALNIRALDYHCAMSGSFRGAFVKHFGPPRPRSDIAEFDQRHRDVAASAQSAFEDAVLKMARQLRKLSGKRRLCIAGGCGLNCTANGKILAEGIFDEVYVPSAPHDSGGAVGAAMLLYARLTGRRPAPIEHAQFGPAFEDSAIASAIRACTAVTAQPLDEATLIDRCATLLTSGGVIAWFQGRMEFGPRALGNRSFLADPRSDAIRETINYKIKKRELFRPFAPSVKVERANDYFEIDQPAPFMTIIVRVRPDKRQTIPAVTHVDGTARPQTVDRDINPRYWRLLDRVEQLTGVPVILNTSFNIQEPIVCTPEQALATFGRSGVDALAMGDRWVTRKGET
jgi:carbamoyltransferase